MTFRDHNPTDKLDYNIDWTKWLNGATIVSSTWTIPDGLVDEGSSNTTVLTTQWLSGGISGTTYRVKNRIQDSLGRFKTKWFFLQVKET